MGKMSRSLTCWTRRDKTTFQMGAASGMDSAAREKGSTKNMWRMVAITALAVGVLAGCGSPGAGGGHIWQRIAQQYGGQRQCFG